MCQGELTSVQAALPDWIVKADAFPLVTWYSSKREQIQKNHLFPISRNKWQIRSKVPIPLTLESLNT